MDKIKMKENSFTSVVLCEHKINTPEEAFEYHMHNEFEIFFFLQGEVNYIVENQIYDLQKGDVLLFNNTEFHQPTLRTKCVFDRYVVHFNPNVVQPLSTVKTHLLKPFLLRPQGMHNLIHLNETEQLTFIQMADKIERESQSEKEGEDVLSVLHLAELLIFLSRIETKTTNTGRLSQHVSQALQYIDKNLYEDISLKSISKALAIDYYYLDKIFKKEIGMTLYHFILLKRLNIARSLLLQGKSVHEACAQTGFKDYSNFIRIFKKYTGITPSAFAREKQG